MIKVRAGLYRLHFEVQDSVTSNYFIEKNDGDYEHRNSGRWIVIHEIEGQTEQWDSDFATLKEAAHQVSKEERRAPWTYEYQGWCSESMWIQQ